MVEFLLPNEWHKELIIQWFYSYTQGLKDLIEFYERLKTAEEIFKTQREENHKKTKNNQSSERH